MFNTTLLAGAPLILQPYDVSFPNRSGLSVLVNSSGSNSSGGLGGTWIALNIAAPGKGGASTVDVDLAPLGGGALAAVKYAWGESHAGLQS